MDSKAIAKGLSDNLKASGWQQVLSMFLNSYDMTDIIEQLMISKEEIGQWIPSLLDSIRWLTECPVHEVKVILLSDVRQNLYGLHTGIPLSGKVGRSEHPILTKMLLSINEMVPGSPDTTRWSRQGVLQMPLSPTWTADRKIGHHKIWNLFTVYLFNKINELFPEAPIILLGTNVHHMAKRFKSPHIYPMTIAKDYVEPRSVWEDVNEILQEQGKKVIKW